MNVINLRDKTTLELQNELLALLQEQFNLRMQKGVEQQSTQTHNFRRVRRDIARVKTILSEKEG